ncbi:MAG: hypothetical protein ACO3NK_07400 [Prochlorotrichaceae cyanobacterium]
MLKYPDRFADPPMETRSLLLTSRLLLGSSTPATAIAILKFPSLQFVN